jgi:hypothetical protein
MERIKRKRIEWFLQLLNMDLKEGSFDEKIDWLNEMPRLFERPPHPGLSGLESLPLWNREMAQLELSQKDSTLLLLREKSRQFLNDLRSRHKTLRESLADDQRFTSSSEFADMRQLGAIKVKVELRVMIKNKPKLERPDGDRSWKAYWPGDSLDKSNLEIVIIPEGGEEGFIFLFAQALDGVPIKSIGRCQADTCNRWFLQSGKKRSFCSNRCRARIGMRDLRAGTSGEIEPRSTKKIKAKNEKVKTSTERDQVREEKKPVRFLRLPKKTSKHNPMED